jgi:hypothetical protein
LPFDIGPDVPKVEVYVPSPEFLAALELIKGKCVSCHDHGVWAGYNNEKQFLKSLANGSKLVTPGDLAASELYRRAALPSSDPDRMPEAPNAALTTAELAILSNWILNFGTTRPAATPTPTPGGTPTPTPTPVGTPAPTPTPLSPEALRFNQAKNILLGRSCMVCHSAWAGQNEAFFKTTMTVSTANNAFPIEPLVVAGNPDGSAIMRRIVTTLPVADRMPRGYPALSTSDIAVLRNWIQNMQ